MAQLPLELILTRELADHLATPVFVVDREGTLEFYNEPAGRLLGARFEETGPMPLDDWAARFTPTDDQGTPLPPDALPLVRTLRYGVLAHDRLHIRGLDGTLHSLEVTAIPLVGIAGDLLGAAALFWETG